MNINKKKNTSILGNIRWNYLCYSIGFAAIVIALLWGFKTEKLNFTPIVMEFFTALSFPSLFIACIAINNIDKIREQIKNEENLKKICSYGEKQDKYYFYKNFKNKYIISSNELLRCIENIIPYESYQVLNNDIKNSIKNESMKCYNYVKDFIYVKSRIMEMKDLYDYDDIENKTLEKLKRTSAYFTEEDLIKLLSELEKMEDENLWNKEKLKSIRECMKRYNMKCNGLWDEINKETDVNLNNHDNNDEMEKIDEY